MRPTDCAGVLPYLEPCRTCRWTRQRPLLPRFRPLLPPGPGGRPGARLPPAGERLADAGHRLPQDRRRPLRLPVRERGRRREGGPLQLPGHRAVLRDRGLRQAGDDQLALRAFRPPGHPSLVTRQFECDNPLDELRRRVEALRAATLPELPPFCGGAVGYAGYDMVRYFEHLPQRPARRPPGARPGLRLLRPDGGLRQRHQDDRGGGHGPARQRRTSPAGGQTAYRRRGLPPRRRLVEQLAGGRLRPAAGRHPHRGRPDGWPTARTSPRSEFEAAVRKCVEYIRAGDIFQVVLSQRLEVPHPRPPVRDLSHAAGGEPQPVHVLRADAQRDAGGQLAGDHGPRGGRPGHHAARWPAPAAAARPTRKTAAWPRSCWPIPRSGPST